MLFYFEQLCVGKGRFELRVYEFGRGRPTIDTADITSLGSHEPMLSTADVLSSPPTTTEPSPAVARATLHRRRSNQAYRVRVPPAQGRPRPLRASPAQTRGSLQQRRSTCATLFRRKSIRALAAQVRSEALQPQEQRELSKLFCDEWKMSASSRTRSPTPSPMANSTSSGSPSSK